jgi:uncharacterized protein YcfJ
MRPIIGAAAVAALAIGGAVVVATSRNNSTAQGYQGSAPAVTTAPAPVVPTASATADTRPGVVVTNPPPAKVVYRDRVAYRAAPASQRVVVKKRSTKKSVAIIGGSTVGGAVVGGLIGGKKGAVIGGVVAGTAGTVYDRKTRKKKVPVE